MTSIQEAYWVGRQSDTQLGGVSTHTFEELDASGIDLERLESAWNRLVRRHDMMRARVNSEGLLEILEEVPSYQIEIDDLADLPEAEAALRLEIVRDRMREEVLAADTWPLFRIRAARLSGGRIRLFTSMDALTLDARSRGVLYKEWRRVYEDPEVELPQIGASFQEFAEEMASVPGTEEFRQARDYWQERLESMPAGPRLHARLPERTNRDYRRIQRDIDQSIVDRIADAADRMDTAIYMLVLTVFSQVLARWSKDERLHVVLTLFEQAARDERFKNTLGDFTTTALVDCSSERGERFEDTARRIEGNLKGALHHSMYNGVMVSRDAMNRGERWPDDACMVVFTNLLGRQHVREWRSAWIGPSIASCSQTPQVALDFQLWSLEDGVRICWDYPSSILDTDMLQAMFDDFIHTLESHGLEDVARPDPEPESPTSSGTLMTDGLCWHVSNRPDAIALQGSSGPMNYGDLGARAMGIATELRRRIPDGKDPVILALPRCREQAVAAIGIQLSGRAYVPVSPDWPADRIEKIVRASGARSMVSLADFGSGEGPLDALARVHVDEVEPTVFAPDTWRADPEDLAYIIFTSGSTGEPKGVAMQHQAAMVTIEEVNKRFVIDADDCAFGISAMTFDLSVWDIFGMLGAGGRLVIADENESKDPGAWARLARRHEVTVWNSVPTLAQLLAERVEEEGAGASLPTRLFLLSGDWIPVPLPDRLRRVAPRCHVISLGGATEAAIWSIAYDIGLVDPAWRSIPYGRALANQTMSIRDENLGTVPDGEIGEIVIGGAGLAKEYIGDPTLSAERFTRDPDGLRVYRTGDLGRMQSDGNIEFLGRSDNQVKIAGYRIELGDVEHALGSHPAVETCLAKAVGPPCGERRLFAYVVGPKTIDVEELKAHAAGEVPDYMIPSVIRVIDRLPLTSNGKVDRNADLEAMASEWGDDHTTVAGNAPEAGPRSRPTTPGSTPAPGADRLADTVSRLAREILDIEKIDVDDSLLDLGASSVDMIRIANRLEMFTGGIRPRLDDIYENPTPRAIGELIAPMTVSEESEAPPPPLDTGGGSAVLSVPGANKNPILSTVLRNREEVLEFKKQNHGRRNDLDGVDGVALPDLHPTPDGRRPRRRMTRRVYSQEQVGMNVLADLLHVLRADGSEERRFNYGSSGPTYPISSYVVAKQGRIQDLAEGTYWFDPDNNRLVPVGGIGEFGPGAVWGDMNKRMLSSAAFGIALVSRHSAIVPVYDRASDRYAILEAGFMSQLIEERAETLDMGVCQVGAMDTELFHSEANLQSDDIILNWIVGGMRLKSGSEGDDAEFSEEIL